MIDSEMAVALWTAFNDKEFLRQNHTILDPELVPRGAARYLVALAKTYWEEQKAILTPQAMMLVVNEGDAQRFGTTEDAAFSVYADVYDRFDFSEADLPVFRLAAAKWFRTLSLSQRLDEAADALEKGELDDADKALRDGYRALTPMQRGKNLTNIRNTIALTFPPACPTGFEIVDKAWVGGIHLGMLGLVLAPWNTGKSMMMAVLAAQALLDNKNVLYYSTELDEDTVLRRVASAIVRKPINNMTPQEAWDGVEKSFALRAERASAEEGGARIPWFEVMYRDALSLSVKDIEADLEMLDEEGHRPHLVILDGDDIRAPRKFDSGYEMYLQIYTDLSTLAMRKKIAIWTAAQGTRQSATKRVVRGHHAADSIAKLRKSDLGISMQHTGHDMDDSGRPIMVFSIIKDRFFGQKDQMFRAEMKFGQGLNGYAAFGPVDSWFVPKDKEEYQ